MGWDALDRWGDDVVRVDRLTGGIANEVWSVCVDGRLAVARLGTRSDADLDWETRLLEHLDREGLRVPTTIPTIDGRLFVDGLVVMAHVEGVRPESEADWRRSVSGGGRRPTSSTPTPARRSTSPRCRPRPSSGAERRGPDSPVARRVWCTATRTPATSS